MIRYVFAAALAGAAVFAAPAMAQQNDLAKYCKSDIERLCKGVPPGGGKIMQCLKAHEKDMTVGCAQALQKMKQSSGK